MLQSVLKQGKITTCNPCTKLESDFESFKERLPLFKLFRDYFQLVVRP